jgi:hypothetical protein
MYKNFIQTSQTKKTSTGYFLILTFLLFVESIFSTSALAADDDYLKALEIEAEKSASVNTNQSKPNKNSFDILIDQKKFKKFESELRSRRPATYKYYRQLNAEEKSVIFSIYQEDQKFTRASKVVFDIYFDKSK